MLSSKGTKITRLIVVADVPDIDWPSEVINGRRMAMRFGRATVALAMIVGLVAATPTRAADPVTITFRFHDTEAEEMRHALDDFEKANPDIKVTMQRASWGEAQQQYLREAAVGAAPDVVELVYVWTRSFAQAGALRPLDDMIQKTGIGIKGWDDFIARDLARGPDGKTYAIPFTADTLALFYNKDVLKAAGVDGPPTSWSGLRDASLAIHRETGKTGFGFAAGTCATPSIWFYLNSYWWSKGHALIDRHPDGSYFMNITPAQIAEAFDYFNRYLKDGDNPKAMTSVCLLGPPEIVEGMVDGDIGIVSIPDFVARRVMAEYTQHFPDKPLPFASAPMPADVDGPKMHFGGRMLGISPNSDHPDADWRLIRFLTQPDPTFTKYWTNYVPAQKAAVAAVKVPPELQGFVEQMKTARSWGPYGTGPVPIPFMWNATGRAIGAVFVGEETSQQAADELYGQISKKLAAGQK